MYLLLAFAFLWTRYVNPTGWSFVRQIGTTSLLVYWVHTEIVYGQWMWYWKESLTPAPVVVIAAVVIAAMVGLSVARTGWKQWPGLPHWPRRAGNDSGLNRCKPPRATDPPLFLPVLNDNWIREEVWQTIVSWPAPGAQWPGPF